MEKSIILPSHVGIIPDGIRRWAKANKSTYIEAYFLAMEKLSEFIIFLFENKIKSISIYLLSKENLKRKLNDLNPVFESELYLFEKILPSIIEKFSVRIKTAGDKNFNKDYKQILNHLEAVSKSYSERILYLLVAYNPYDEIINAVIKHPITNQSFQEYLWVDKSLDLVVRTSGEKRLSNFLPLQSGYAELIFSNKLFNDLDLSDYEKFLNEYHNRKRRFGE